MSTLGNLFSLARAGYVLAREGVISALPSDPLPPPARFGQKLAGLIRRSRARNTTRSEKLSVALNRLGPSWVKLGQFLAIPPGILTILWPPAGLVLAMVGQGNTTELVMLVAARVMFSLLAALLASLLFLRFMTHSRFGRRLILDTGLGAAQGYASAPETDQRLLGRHGVTATPLHPAGIALIDGTRVDVVSNGSLIEAGQPVVVDKVDGNRVVVVPAPQQEPNRSTT